MSSNIIPMLPSTPPPLDESVESDDDELGNFTTVLGKYDDSLTEVPRSTCDEPQIKSDKNKCTNHYVQSRNDKNIQKTEICLGNSFKHLGDFPDKSIAKDISSDDDKKSSRKSSLENNKNAKVERIASEMQEKIQMDDSKRYSPILNDTESQIDSSLRINQESTKDDSGCLTENNQPALVASSVEGYVSLSDNETSEIQDSNRTAVSSVKEDEDTSGVYTLEATNLDLNDSVTQETEEMTENKRIHIPSQQYRNSTDSEDPSTFVLPLVPKPNETVSLQQRSNLNSLEPSPISLSENFTSASDVSSELSNFETAKSSPNSTDTCDKQEVIERSEGNGIEDRKESEYDIKSKDSVDESSCTSVSPLVFQETIPTEINCEGDDDFADFQQANDGNYFSSMTVIKIDDDESHLCDLNEEGVSSKPNIDYGDSVDFAQTTLDNDEFADFASAHQNSSWSHTQDDFADFECASFEVEMPKDESENHVPLTEVSEKGKGKVAQLVYASFPTIYEEKTPEEADEVFPFRNETDYTSMLLRGRSKRLWDRLQDLDTTPAMLFRWGSSQCFQTMLHSLNIDSHSILRNPSVPIYASSLGLLEPTKGPQSPKHQTTVNKHISFQEVVPPAQFDWSDSGLINPLDTSQASGLFELEFFTAQNSVSSITDVVGSELEAELFGPSTVCVASGDKDNRSPLITQILASSKSTIFPSTQRQCSRPAGLSDEVVRVLDKLPDLSFMQAKVLMFPIHSLSDH